MKGILEGIRIVDWTVWHVGASATAMLADMGAEVIKIEEPGTGDSVRGLSVMRAVPMDLPHGRHVLFEDLNRNKKDLAIDLTKAGARDIMDNLIKKSDVFVSNVRLASAKKFGLDAERIRKVNPKIIYAHANALGQKGPHNDRPGIEPVGYGRSGVMMASGEGPEPAYVTASMGDRIGGVYLAYGVLGALLARERFGVAQEVYTSQLGALVTLQAATVISYLLTGKKIERPGRKNMRNPLYGLYQCKDGHWIILGLLQAERFWPILCKTIGMPELEKDPKFVDTKARAANAKELVAILDKVFAGKTAKEWDSILGDNGLWSSIVNDIDDLPKDPQVIANDYIIDYDHPDLGRVKIMGYPVEFTETPLSVRSVAPHVGQNTEEILTEICGYGWDDVNGFREAGII